MKYLLIAAGGAAGSLLRYLTATWIGRFSGQLLPWGTLTVNATGSFLIGMLWAMTASNFISAPMRFLLFTGFLGGFTTYSSFSGEVMGLFQEGHHAAAMAYVVFTNVLCIGLAFGGFYFARIFFSE